MRYLSYIYAMSDKMVGLLPVETELESKVVLKKLTQAHKVLAELKGV